MNIYEHVVEKMDGLTDNKMNEYYNPDIEKQEEIINKSGKF